MTDVTDKKTGTPALLKGAAAAAQAVEKAYTPVAPAIITGAADHTVDTNDPDFRKDMTPEDEKRTGHDGRPAVLGKPWSIAGTGLWLIIGCVQPPVGERRPKVPMDGFWNEVSVSV